MTADTTRASPRSRIKAILGRADAHHAAHVHALCYLEADEGVDWCRECAEARAGGGRIHRLDPSACHDSPPTCEGCGRELAGHLTDHGAREELASLEDRFDPTDGRQCRMWALCETAFPERSEEYRRLLAVADHTESTR